MSVETQVLGIIDNILQSEGVKDAINCFMVHDENEEKKYNLKVKAHKENFSNFLTGLTQDSKVIAVRFVIYAAGENCNQQRIKLLFSILEYSVSSNAVPSKTVCENFLSCTKLTWANQDFWCEGFHLIRKIIGGVDYKGVRDLMKSVLEKASCAPVEINVSNLAQINALTEVVEYIFDRNACLLPSYFIVNEIQKMYPDYKSWPHWKLASLLSKFSDSFLPVAQMVSITGRCRLLPIAGYSTIINMWKLDSKTLRFFLNGLLPYKKELIEPQSDLLKFVIEQPYSNDIVCNMLGLNKKNKQRCPALEEQLVDLVVVAMEKSEIDSENSNEDGTSCRLLWQHLSSQLIFFVLFQFARLPHMVQSLHSKLMSKNLKKGRDQLMWVLLQFISGSFQNNPLSDFLPVLNLYDFLYSEKEPLPVPNTENTNATRQMAVTCIWIHLMRKAQTEQVVLSRPVPHVLKNHVDFLQQNLLLTQSSSNVRTDYSIALLCNAYSTNQDYFMRPLQALLESIHSNQKTQTPMPGNCIAAGPTQPLSVEFLDSLTVHAKMSLIHGIGANIMKLAQAKSNLALAPALVETYGRLLVYTEIESLSVKGFIGQLLPHVFKSHAYGILHTLLEMFSYRLHHIQPHYRVQLLSNLHSLASVPQTNQTQLHLCVESTALRLITGLGSSEVQPQLSRFINDPKTLISAESEELNRVLVLTLARAMNVTGSESLSGTWCKDIVSTIMQNTPHNWSSYTLNCFPPVLAEIFQQNHQQKENISQLKTRVEEEYRKWKSMSNESDIIAHFSLHGTPPLFLCLLWKMLLENDQISPVAYKVLERVGARALSAHLRTLADFLVHEFSVSAGGQHVKKCIEALNGLIWKSHVITLDRLVLCLALRSFEGNEAQVCFFIIQLLLLKPQDFRNRINEFIKENSPEHWKQSNWHEKHITFHKKFPERFQHESEHSSQNNQPYLPVYFGNVCLRFLPVFDIVIHRFLELPQVAKSPENLLDHLGSLYKFHDRPITYLYNTLHYYEKKLKDRAGLKKKLVSTIIGSQKEIRPKGWCLSEAYENYIEKPAEDVTWVQEQDYYMNLVGKLVVTISGKIPSQYLQTDWRFNEFPNASVHVLHCICIELMALPESSSVVGNALLDVALKGHTQLQRSSVESWINGIALIMTALPDSYWLVLHTSIIEMLQSPLLKTSSGKVSSSDILEVFDFTTSHQMYREISCSYLLALSHAFWHHATIGQISKLPQFIKQELKPIVKTEEQFLYVCHLVAPFLVRFNTELKKCVLEITIELYEMLENVDKACKHLNYMDCICDLLYHIKYMFTGDSVKAEAAKVISNLRHALQLRLRFITHLNIKEVTFPQNEATPTSISES